MDAEVRKKCEEAAGLWEKSSFAVALTGAGISVPSGIPDFRSPGGLWSKFDPYEVCSQWALENNPEGVWEFMFEAVGMFSKATPNPAHIALADLDRKGRLEAVITQNIDGLHQAAGNREVVEFHGGCNRYFCHQCKREFGCPGTDEISAGEIPWMCPRCGGIVRPDVVFFGEQIPPRALTRTQELAAKADLAVVIGTSGEVAPANTVPHMIVSGGGRMIEVNLGRTQYASIADVQIHAPAEEVLPEIEKMVPAAQ
ncbi:MAG: NAD-dependent protein deacylase [Desulfonatronovibrionaceae bacterium]